MPSLRPAIVSRLVLYLPSALPLGSLVIALTAGCANLDPSVLTAQGGKPVAYRCAQGEHVVARYYVLSDDSLRFVKLVLPGNRAYTLPQAVSGSGARYTDDRDLVWWIKGDTASVQTRGPNAEWRTTLECTAR